MGNRSPVCCYCSICTCPLSGSKACSHFLLSICGYQGQVAAVTFSQAAVRAPSTALCAAHRQQLQQSAHRLSVNTSGVHHHSSTSALLLMPPPLPVLSAPHVLKGPHWRIRYHQAISHPLVHQGGVRGYSTQQHWVAPVQHQTDAAHQRQRGVWHNLESQCVRQRR